MSVYVTLNVAPNDLPDMTDEGQHITLAYFNDEYTEESLDSVLFATEEISKIELNNKVKTETIELFGEAKDAVVLTLDSNIDSTPVMLRRIFIDNLSMDAYEWFKESQTFIEYRPHMTLGYISEGYDVATEFDIPEFLEIESVAVNSDTDDIHYVFPLNTELAHYGTPRKSGRYPWGSGDDPYQSGKSFMGAIEEIKKAQPGISDPQISKIMGMTTPEWRARKSIAGNNIRKAEEIQIIRMKEKGMSNQAIGDRLGISEPTVRNRLKTYEQGKEDIILATADTLRNEISNKNLLDIGEGTELYLGVSKEKLKSAIVVLEDEGYQIHHIQLEQMGNPGKFTQYKLITPPGTTSKEVYERTGEIDTVASYSTDGGQTYRQIEAPISVNPKRIDVRYGPDGGSDMDGVIQLRRGVDDLSLGNANYAQVRVKVGEDRYLKGMAMYADDLPDGVDIRFNTNKKDTGNKLDAMKKIEDDPTNPFKATIRQKTYVDSKGNIQLSPLNIVGTEDPSGIKHPGEEGGWSEWSKKLSSQMLSKQTTTLAKEQLNQAYQLKKEKLDEIKSLTNPTVKKMLLEKFADGADSSAVKLKAAALPGTANHVILPFPSMSPNEVYAPGYPDGTRVVLIRHPHGGRFEIPELIVNNKNKEAKKVIPNAKDAVGIHPSVAQKLSGADFDGDTVLVIPNNTGKIKSKPMLEGLKDFDPKIYKYDDPKHPKMKSATTQNEMGKISNLITDMTLKGANDTEILRAVRHSMVVIDAEKHGLDYKQSAADNAVAALKERYQGRYNAGASTIVSRASAEQRVPEIKKRKAKDGGPVDPKTGKIVWEPTGATYQKRVEKKDGTVEYNTETRVKKYPSMALTDDARTLVSSPSNSMEMVYANHANSLKALANDARKEALKTPPLRQSPSARAQYAPETAALNAKLKTALMNKPLERVAQVKATVNYRAKRDSDPTLTKDQLKKLKARELAEARAVVGAKKQAVKITNKEWEAIQAGAISDNMLQKILQNTDIDVVKQYAMPRTTPTMSNSRIARAKTMLSRGYTQAEVAEQLGVSTSTLSSALSGKV